MEDGYEILDDGCLANKPTDTSSEVSTCTAGLSSEERANMEARMAALKEQATKLAESLKARDSEIDSLKRQLNLKEARIVRLQEDLQQTAASSEAVPDEPSEAAGSGKSLDAMDAKEKEAANGRLRRLCQMRADGSLAVPLQIHNQWKEGGNGRKQLLSLFVSLNFDRDCLQGNPTLADITRNMSSCNILKALKPCRRPWSDA